MELEKVIKERYSVRSFKNEQIDLHAFFCELWPHCTPEAYLNGK